MSALCASAVDPVACSCLVFMRYIVRYVGLFGQTIHSHSLTTHQACGESLRTCAALFIQCFIRRRLRKPWRETVELLLWSLTPTYRVYSTKRAACLARHYARRTQAPDAGEPASPAVQHVPDSRHVPACGTVRQAHLVLTPARWAWTRLLVGRMPLHSTPTWARVARPSLPAPFIRRR